MFREVLSGKLELSSWFVNNSLSRIWQHLLPADQEFGSGRDITLTLSVVSISAILYALHQTLSYDDDLPIVNRLFTLEPRVFARWRWLFNSRNILENANQKYGNRAFRLARGDTDLTVLPASLVPELNKLPQDALDSRKSHASTLLGHLNGMDVVTKTHLHVKLLLSRVTPAMISLIGPVCARIEDTLTKLLPQSNDEWILITPVEKIVTCISRSVALTTFGPPLCDDPLLVQTLVKHTRNVFSVAFIMRLVPWFLQPLLVWVLPDKWRLRQTWSILERFTYSEVEKRLKRIENGETLGEDLISCLASEVSNGAKVDRELIKGVIGSIAAGATYSSAALITTVIADLLSQPAALEEIREEIQSTNKDCGGHWTAGTLNALFKLESAMKETARITPGTLLVYARVVTKDVTLSGGLRLKKNQSICVSGHARTNDSRLFPKPEKHDALRYYKANLEDHRLRPFNSVDADDFRWGSGRWSCPGRYIATQISKIILLKLLDEYEFKFRSGRRPKNSTIHEFVFMHPSTEFLVRRRKENSGISFCA